MSTVRVGVMPGKIQEVAVEVGTPISQVIEFAGLNATGYDVKVDGTKVDASTATVTESTSLILLVKQVKGNADGVVRVGMMPGKINEFAVEIGTPIADLLDQAGLEATGYDVKVDGEKVDLSTAKVTSSTSLVLLVKQVKGNADGVVRVGMMPGKINEYAVEVGTPISEVIADADLDASGYDVKVDGVKVDLSTATVSSSTSLILLVKQVKGNN